MAHVPELVGEHDPDLVQAEAAVQKRVPEDDALRGPEPLRVGVDERRRVADLGDADVGGAGAAARLEPGERGRELRLRGRRALVVLVEVGKDESEERRKGDEYWSAGHPPEPTDPTGERHRDGDEEERQDR